MTKATNRDLLPLLTGLALLMGLVNRLVAGWDAPLWFDESFSAEIASQTSGATLLEWCLHELSGPVYYTTLFLWEKVAGNDDVALRIPSFLFSIAAPLLILWRGHPDREVRMLWAAIMALWALGFDLATEARPYTLMLLWGTVQGIAFLRLMRAPTTRAALLWTSVSALAVLTHYHAAVICGVQGVAYLIAHRERALRSWPAVAPLVPMAAWMVFHVPFVLGFAAPGTAWYQTLSLRALWLIPHMLAGVEMAGVILIALIVGTLALRRPKGALGVVPELCLIGSGLVAAALVIAVGFFQPTFNPRYLLPYMPALLFGIAFWARWISREVPLAGTLLIAAMLGWSVQPLIARLTNPRDDHRYGFNFEQPSRWIGAHDVRRLVFLWDSPSMSISDPRHIAAVGSFFLRRDGKRVQMEVQPWPAPGVDPNRVLLAAAGDDPHAAILWAYDVAVPGTRGIAHPQRIMAIDPRRECHNFGRGGVTVLACMQRR